MGYVPERRDQGQHGHSVDENDPHHSGKPVTCAAVLAECESGPVVGAFLAQAPATHNEGSVWDGLDPGCEDAEVGVAAHAGG